MKFRKPKEPILVIDDDKNIIENFQFILDNMGIEYNTAENGEKGLRLAEKELYSIYIVDLDMPVMDGKTFIAELKKIYKNPIILVQTGNTTTETIINVMKLGVFDYIIKPFKLEDFERIIKKALDYKYLIEMEKQESLNASLKLRSQIEWLNYKETVRTSSKDNAEIKSIENLKHSLLQGGGIGSLLSLIDVLEQSYNPDNAQITIQSEMFKLLLDIKHLCEMQFQSIIQTNDILSSKIIFESLECNQVIEQIPEMIQIIKPFFAKKNLLITYPSVQSNFKIQINIKFFSMVIEELIINAYKYSIPNVTVNIYSHISEGYLVLTIKNFVEEKPYGGIPKELEKMVLEPFFRINHFVDEDISKIEKFGLGLGLTVVDNIIRKHNGLFFIHEVKDHTTASLKIAVIAEIFIPIVV